MSGGAGGLYRPTDTPGVWEIDTTGGPLSVPATEEELRAQGYQPDTAPINVPIGDDSGLIGGIKRAAGAVGDWWSGKDLSAPNIPPAPPRSTAPAAPDNGTSLGVGEALGFGRRAPEPASPVAPSTPGGIDRGTGTGRRVAAEPSPRGGGGGKATGTPIDPRTEELVGMGLTVDDAREGAEWAQAQGEPPSVYDQVEEAAADRSINRGLMAQQRADQLTARSETESAARGRQIREEQLAIAEQKRRNAEMARQYQERQMAIDREREEVKALKVDPGKWWADQPGWAQVLAGIAILAGGVNAGIKGGENEALKAINGAIDRNIQTQREQIALRREGLRDQENELERLTRIYGTPEAAEAELRDRSRLLVQSIGQKTLVDAGAQDAAFALQQQLSAWDDERVAGQQQLAAALADGVRQDMLRAEVASAAPIAGLLEQPEVEKLGGEMARQDLKPKGTGGGPVKDDALRAIATDIEKAGLGESEGKLGAVEDLISELPGDGELPTYSTRNIASKAVRDIADKVAGTGSGAELMDTDAERSAVAKVEQIKGELRHELSGAAVNDSEMKLLEAQLDRINTAVGLKSFAGDLRRRIQRRKAGILAGHDPAAVQEYYRRKKAYNVAGRPSSFRAE